MTDTNAEHAQQDAIPRRQIREVAIGRALVTCYLNGLIDFNTDKTVTDILRENLSRRIIEGVW